MLEGLTLLDLIGRGIVILIYIALIGLYIKSDDFSDGNVGSDDNGVSGK